MGASRVAAIANILKEGLSSYGFKEYVKDRIRENLGYLPGKGIVAGQSIATFAMEYFWEQSGPINDIDIFVPITKESYIEMTTEMDRGEEILHTLDITPGTTPISLPFLASSSYNWLFLVNNSVYRIAMSKMVGIANYVLIMLPLLEEMPRNKAKGYLIEHLYEFLPRYVVASFDMNGVQIGYVPKTDEIVFTDRFVKFMATRQMEVVKFHTPARSLLRLQKKIREIYGIWGSGEESLYRAIFSSCELDQMLGELEIIKEKMKESYGYHHVEGARILRNSLPHIGRVAPIVGRNNYKKFSKDIENSDLFDMVQINNKENPQIGHIDLWRLVPTRKAYEEMEKELRFMDKQLSVDRELYSKFLHLRKEMDSTVFERKGDPSMKKYPKLIEQEVSFALFFHASRKKESERKAHFMSGNGLSLHSGNTFDEHNDTLRTYGVLLPLISYSDTVDKRLLEKAQKVSKRIFAKRRSDSAMAMRFFIDSAFAHLGAQKAVKEIAAWDELTSEELDKKIGTIESMPIAAGIDVDREYMIGCHSFFAPLFFSKKYMDTVMKNFKGFRWDPWMKEMEFDDGMIIREIISKDDMNKEGKEMRHCVSGYTNLAASRQVLILQVLEKGENSSINERWTVEVRIRNSIDATFSEERFKTAIISQIKGYQNKLPFYPKHKAMLDRIAEALMRSKIMPIGCAEYFQFPKKDPRNPNAIITKRVDAIQCWYREYDEEYSRNLRFGIQKNEESADDNFSYTEGDNFNDLLL